MRLRAIILGCGSSGGVPRPGGPNGEGLWGVCDPKNPKNYRTRCSILVQRADETLGFETPNLTTVLIDTSPDLRTQLLAAKVGRLDAVFYTHDHADQSHGIDDLRIVAMNRGERIPVYLSRDLCPELVDRFAYCFTQAKDSPYEAILEEMPLPESQEVIIDGPTGPIAVQPFLQEHGRINSYGFIFGGRGGLAYTSDANDLPQRSFDVVKNAHTWIVDCLREAPHPSHAHLDLVLKWVKKTNMQRSVLTNMHYNLDYEAVKQKLPENIEPAFDNMIVGFEISPKA
ncbi:MAG: MBL fold metallo-hydrolase [Parvularculaceae bacterium]